MREIRCIDCKYAGRHHKKELNDKLMCNCFRSGRMSNNTLFADILWDCENFTQRSDIFEPMGI